MQQGTRTPTAFLHAHADTAACIISIKLGPRQGRSPDDEDDLFRRLELAKVQQQRDGVAAWLTVEVQAPPPLHGQPQMQRCSLDLERVSYDRVNGLTFSLPHPALVCICPLYLFALIDCNATFKCESFCRRSRLHTVKPAIGYLRMRV